MTTFFFNNETYPRERNARGDHVLNGVLFLGHISRMVVVSVPYP
jgi:hypothetical protein